MTQLGISLSVGAGIFIIFSMIFFCIGCSVVKEANEENGEYRGWGKEQERAACMFRLAYIFLFIGLLILSPALWFCRT